MEAAAIIASIRAGSVDAFEEIVEQYQAPIIRYLYRLTGDYDVAQDLTQDTFVQAYKNILKTDSELKLNAWLYRIATNNAYQYHRRKKIIGFIPLENLKNPESRDNGAHPADEIEGLAVREAISKVPYNLRTCLVLYYVEGFKYQEIAETIGITKDAVRKRVAKGVEVFRRLYEGGSK